VEAVGATFWAGLGRMQELWPPNVAPFGPVKWPLSTFVLPSSLIWRTRPSASGTQPRPAFEVHAGQHSSIATSAGKRGSGYYYVVRRNDADVELYIDRRKEAEAENKAIFDTLAESRAAIEAAFGESLDWQRLEGRRACRIKKDINVGGYRDEEKWPHIHDAMIDAMLRLEKGLKPHIARLDV